MKHIVFSIVVLCAVAAQATYYNKYYWQGTEGGEFSTVDATKGWEQNGTHSSPAYDQYYLQTAQSAALTLSNDWTLVGMLRVDTATNVFDFGESTLTVSNGFNVEKGGGLLLKSGAINSLSSIIVQETGTTAAESLTIDNATLQITGNFYHRTTTANDYDSVVMITNHAVLSASSGFYTAGGSTNAHVFIADNSSLTAGDATMGQGWSGYADGGRAETVTFSDNSTGTFTGNASIGEGVPHTTLEVLSGSTVSFNNFFVGTKTASSNNLVVVDNATMNVSSSGTAYYFHIGGREGTKYSYSCGNTLVVTNGGTLTVGKVKYDYCVGRRGSGNRLVVTGPNSTATFASGSIYIGRIASGDAVSGTNAVIVTDHAQLTVSNSVYVGYSQAGINPDGGLENRLEVTDGATANLTSGVSVYPGSSIQTTNATISFGSVPKLYHDTRCAFVDSTVSFGGDGDVGGTSSAHSNAELCFTNSTLTADGVLRIGTTNFVLRLHNSTATMNGGIQTCSYRGSASSGTTIVFSGAAPEMTLPTLNWYAPSTLRFEIPKEGFPTDCPIMTATGNDGFYQLGNAGTRTVEVAVDSACPEGTYTLLQGQNANANWITTKLEFDPTVKKVKVLTGGSGANAVLQVRVKNRQNIGAAVYLK